MIPPEHTGFHASVDASAYDAVYFVGGKGTMFDFPDDPATGVGILLSDRAVQAMYVRFIKSYVRSRISQRLRHRTSLPTVWVSCSRMQKKSLKSGLSS